MDKSKIKNLCDYIAENIHSSIVPMSLMVESVNNRDILSAIQKVQSFLVKRGIYTIPSIELSNVDRVVSFNVYSFTQDNRGCTFVWDRKDTSELAAVAFTKDFDSCYAAHHAGDAETWDVYVRLKGASIVRVIQLVADVMKGKIPMTTQAINAAIRDAQVWESVDSDDIDDTMVVESDDDPIIKDIKKKMSAVYMKKRYWEKTGKDTTELQKQYDELKDQLTDARLSVQSNVQITPIKDAEVQKIERRFEEEVRALPEERFSDMEAYVLNVILGLDTCALICGAPGVGKTYRIMQMIKKEGKVRGTDYEVIKGKVTPLKLYTLLHDFQKHGQMLILDDADTVITDDTNIQLIKAATDSSDERIVAYASSNMPIVPDEKIGLFDDWETNHKGQMVYPKNFVYEGSIVIITNMSAGQIDTAIRSRALICDLNFTTDEIIGLIETLSPHIMPELLTPEAKGRALEYIKELAETTSQIELSIRTFTMLAKMFMSDAPENAIKRRISEQLKLKFLRGGKKY